MPEESIWKKLSNVNIQNKEFYEKVFIDTVQQVQNNEFSPTPKEIEYNQYFVVIEENRAGSYFIHIVPKELYSLFKEMQTSAPHQFLGFSILAGKHTGKDVRVSCFGVQCNLLGKSLIKKTIPK